MVKFLKDLSNKISEYSEDIVFQMVLILKGLLKIICLMETDNFIGQTELNTLVNGKMGNKKE
jgi:hypothetical protein